MYWNSPTNGPSHSQETRREVGYALFYDDISPQHYFWESCHLTNSIQQQRTKVCDRLPSVSVAQQGSSLCTPCSVRLHKVTNKLSRYKIKQYYYVKYFWKNYNTISIGSGIRFKASVTECDDLGNIAMAKIKRSLTLQGIYLPYTAYIGAMKLVGGRQVNYWNSIQFQVW